MSSKQPLLVPGRRFRVKHGFTNGPRGATSTFILGEFLIFEREAFSIYDNSFVYEFRPDGGSETKQWWVLADKPAEPAEQYFELLPGML